MSQKKKKKVGEIEGSVLSIISAFFSQSECHKLYPARKARTTAAMIGLRAEAINSESGKTGGFRTKPSKMGNGTRS